MLPSTQPAENDSSHCCIDLDALEASMTLCKDSFPIDDPDMTSLSTCQLTEDACLYLGGMAINSSVPTSNNAFEFNAPNPCHDHPEKPNNSPLDWTTTQMIITHMDQMIQNLQTLAWKLEHASYISSSTQPSFKLPPTCTCVYNQSIAGWSQ